MFNLRLTVWCAGKEQVMDLGNFPTMEEARIKATWHPLTQRVEDEWLRILEDAWLRVDSLFQVELMFDDALERVCLSWNSDSEDTAFTESHDKTLLLTFEVFRVE